MNLRDEINAELAEQAAHLAILKEQMIQTDAGMQALRWVLRKMDEEMAVGLDVCLACGCDRKGCCCSPNCCTLAVSE